MISLCFSLNKNQWSRSWLFCCQDRRNTWEGEGEAKRKCLENRGESSSERRIRWWRKRWKTWSQWKEWESLPIISTFSSSLFFLSRHDVHDYDDGLKEDLVDGNIHSLSHLHHHSFERSFFSLLLSPSSFFSFCMISYVWGTFSFLSPSLFFSPGCLPVLLIALLFSHLPILFQASGHHHQKVVLCFVQHFTEN